MPAQVERGDLEKIARNLGKAGRPLPGSMQADRGLVEAYHQAAGTTPPAAPSSAPAAAPTSPPAAAPAAPTARRPAPTRPAAGRPSRPGYLSRAFSPTAAARRFAGGRGGAAVRAGDAGGMLLALVVYPVVLATIQHGSAGPGEWFRAKWLNNTSPPVSIITGPDGRAYPSNGSWQDQYPNMPGYVPKSELKPGSPDSGQGTPPFKNPQA